MSSLTYGQKKNYFGVGIVASANSAVLSYAIVTKTGDTYLGTQLISEQFFMYFALGYWPSKANPNRENLFKKNNIENCYLTYSESGKVNGYYNGPFQELWKLRYQNHPQNRDAPSGWSQGHYKPSIAQAQYLHKEYGILHINTHYFIGESLFRLLRDVQNPDWINMYQNL